MTVTVHWWSLPVLMCLAAVLLFIRGWWFAKPGLLAGLGEAVVATGLIIGAGLFVAGHYV